VLHVAPALVTTPHGSYWDNDIRYVALELTNSAEAVHALLAAAPLQTLPGSAEHYVSSLAIKGSPSALDALLGVTGVVPPTAIMDATRNPRHPEEMIDCVLRRCPTPDDAKRCLCDVSNNLRKSALHSALLYDDISVCTGKLAAEMARRGLVDALLQSVDDTLASELAASYPYDKTEVEMNAGVALAVCVRDASLTAAQCERVAQLASRLPARADVHAALHVTREMPRDVRARVAAMCVATCV
jgi:hypothetical protein